MYTLNKSNYTKNSNKQNLQTFIDCHVPDIMLGAENLRVFRKQHNSAFNHLIREEIEANRKLL